MDRKLVSGGLHRWEVKRLRWVRIDESRHAENCAEWEDRMLAMRRFSWLFESQLERSDAFAVILIILFKDSFEKYVGLRRVPNISLRLTWFGGARFYEEKLG